MENIKDIPYIVHEGIVTRLERTIEKLWILCIILIVLLVGTNGAWIYYENTFVDTVETTTIDASQDGEGINIIGGGDVNYGAESEDNQNDQDTIEEGAER